MAWVKPADRAAANPLAMAAALPRFRSWLIIFGLIGVEISADSDSNEAMLPKIPLVASVDPSLTMMIGNLSRAIRPRMSGSVPALLNVGATMTGEMSFSSFINCSIGQGNPLQRQGGIGIIHKD